MIEKIEKVKMEELSRIAENTQVSVNNIKCCFDETEKILEKVNDITEYKYEKELEKISYEFCTYGKYITISDIKDSQLYDGFIIALTELYNSGEKEASYNEQIKYSFKKTTSKWGDTIYIYLRVHPSVTGCKIVKENIIIPEHTEPEHTEEKLKVVCDE